MPDGSVYVVRRPTAATDGAFVEMEFVLPAGCVPPPPHVHPHQVEDYEVLGFGAGRGAAHLQEPLRADGPVAQLAPPGNAV
jgi:hypothetical protein